MQVEIELVNVKKKGKILQSDIDRTVAVLTKLLQAGCKEGQHITHAIRDTKKNCRGWVTVYQQQKPTYISTKELPNALKKGMKLALEGE
jgi:hypothetical protein